MNYKDPKVKCRITHIGKTNDNLTDRAGLTIISRYIRSLGVPCNSCREGSLLYKKVQRVQV